MAALKHASCKRKFPIIFPPLRSFETYETSERLSELLI